MADGRDDDRPVAFVTGASRGIGKAIAIHLARDGYDLALGARTMNPGEARESSSTVRESKTEPLPGSLRTTAEVIEAEGATALSVYLDLLDRVTWGTAITTVLERWGRIDVLVNNGRYIGPGHMDLFLDTPIELIDRHMEGNVIAPLALIRLVLGGMVARGSGTIINVTSRAAYLDPTAPAGQGGWGLGYGTSKAALHRVAGILAVELGDRGVRAYNLNPGLVETERTARDGAAYGLDPAQGAAPPDAIGAVAAWLLTSDDAARLPNGAEIDGQKECRERGLLTGWG